MAASQLPARLLVLLAGMIPAPGKTPGQWWANTGYRQAAAEQARLDGGKTGHDDPLISFYNAVPRPLAEPARKLSEPLHNLPLGADLAAPTCSGTALRAGPG